MIKNLLRTAPLFAFFAHISLFPVLLAEPFSPANGKTVQTILPETFEPFTGRIRRNKVRVRMKPDLQSAIMSEASQGQLVKVLAEKEDFYAIQPPEKIHVYLYRTYVLNGIIDASSVNLRLHPELTAPIIGQLNKGERVQATVSKEDDKWLEMDLPKEIPFYIAKELVEYAGPPSYFTKMEQRREEAAELVNLAGRLAEQSATINQQHRDLAHACRLLKQVSTDYTDCPDLAARAQQMYATFQDQIKKLPQFEECESIALSPISSTSLPKGMPETMTSWIGQEQLLFEEWRLEHPGQDITAFYEAERAQGISLTGIIQPYTRLVRNRPGNFLLIHPVDNHPIAFLYSTQVDLRQQLNETVTLLGVPRQNHHFAFPAFFILSME